MIPATRTSAFASHAADHILRTYGRDSDDALVVVARIVGVRRWPA
jgi:hypothetical protein